MAITYGGSLQILVGFDGVNSEGILTLSGLPVPVSATNFSFYISSPVYVTSPITGFQLEYDISSSYDSSTAQATITATPTSPNYPTVIPATVASAQISYSYNAS